MKYIPCIRSVELFRSHLHAYAVLGPWLKSSRLDDNRPNFQFIPMAHHLIKLGKEALQPQKVNGVWHKAVISAKNIARLRKEALLSGRYAQYHFTHHGLIIIIIIDCLLIPQ